MDLSVWICAGIEATDTPVVLWGTAPTVEYVARQAGTIAYELLCGVSARVPRIFVNRDS
jgi:alanine racemase